ncbi:MAG: serine/threonine protein kinase [Deltaproteobacteria bacterium]|nr:serine/threonine protein kinase [Deltaproteobacteria bacterium]
MSRFTIIRKLGEGGMATVHLATYREKGEPQLVALKKMKRAAAMDPTQLELFVRELRVAAQLNHPNVVKVFDAGVEEDRPYLSMEYVDGPDLDTVIEAAYRGNQRISPAFVAYVGARVCEALTYVLGLRDATGAPLITAHRDISPSNVLLSARGAVKLADFGVVRMSNSATAVGIVKGKWEYFPPEIITGKPQDARGDLFALGITLYKLFALSHPFSAPTPQEHFQRARTEDPVRPREMPDGLWRVLKSALARDPDARFPTAAAMAQALDAYVVHSGERMGPAQVAERIRKLPLQRPTTDDHVSMEEYAQDFDVIPGTEEDADDATTEPGIPLRRPPLAPKPSLVDEDTDVERTELGLPSFVTAQLARAKGRAVTGVGTAPMPPAPDIDFDRLYGELQKARRAAGLAVDMSAVEFRHLLIGRREEILKQRPGMKVRFEIGTRQGKPVVVPKVSRR